MTECVTDLGLWRRAATAIAVCLHLSACSTYSGQITNAAQPAGQEGPPLLTNGFTP